MRGPGHDIQPKDQLLLSIKVFRVLLFTICVQLTRSVESSSVNSTIEITQISKKEDIGQVGNVPSSGVSLSRNNLPRCGGIYSVRPEDLAFRIYSPDYPLPYPSLLNCIYDIQFKGESFPCHMDFYFEDFYLSSEPPDCYGDRLEIGGQRFCGGLSGVQRFETEWNLNGERHILLNLVTDGLGTGRGFKICVSQVPCNGPLPVPPTYLPSPPEFQPPSIPPPPLSPPFYPPWHPHLTPPRPPSYLPPIFSPWGGVNVPLCCGTQYQDHRIHLISPGFPSQLPVATQCGYVINRLNPSVTQLKVHFKYFFLPCPRDSLQSEGGSFYPGHETGYLSIDNRNICGCQTGLIITVPFSIFETRKVLRFYSPSINPFSRTQKDNGFPPRLYNEQSHSNSRKTYIQFRTSPHDYLDSKKSDNPALAVGDAVRVTGAQPKPNFESSQLVSFPWASHLTDTVASKHSQKLTETNLTNKEGNTTSSTNSKSGRAFDSFHYNHPNFGPPSGFLLEVIQEEIPYYSARRRNTFSSGSNTESSSAKTLPSSNNPNAVSRFFHLASRICRESDWPQVKWWLIWLHKKHLLQACPARNPPSPQPPYIPPFCDQPFTPISW